MKRLLGLLALVTLLLLGCGQAPPTPEARLERALARMSTPQKLGQMLLIGFHGTTVNDDVRFMLAQYHVGGVVLFDRNLAGAEQARRLTAELQHCARQPVPLLIALDQEGGEVVRGESFLTAPPSQAEIGAGGDTTRATESAAAVARELRALGVNLNLAPVADVGKGSRCFSDDEATVSRFVQAAADGYERERFLYALKHFPGLGAARVDSHRAAVETTMSLHPFMDAITRRDPAAYLMLVSHHIYPSWDADNGASTSRAVLTDLLRSKLGYRGVIATDDLEMGATREQAANFRELGVKAVKAGADLLLVCHEYAHESDVYLGLLDAVERGEIPLSRIDDSVRRILRLKQRLSP